MSVDIVAIGLGDREQLTPAALRRLQQADVVYAMASPTFWILEFLGSLFDGSKLRPYYPRTVAWGQWHDDPVFEEIADELLSAHDSGVRAAVVTAGDVSIYGNVTPLLPKLKARGLSWSVYPGISFLNAVTMVTGQPLVGEGDSLFLTRIASADELDRIFSIADRVALYDPQHANGLIDYIRSGRVSYAVAALAGVNGAPAQMVDLLAEPEARIRGIVILHRKEPGDGRHPVESAVQEIGSHLGLNGWDSQGRFFAVRYPGTLMVSESGSPSQLKVAFNFPDRPSDTRGFFIDASDRIFVSLKGFAKSPFGRTYMSEDGGNTFSMVLPRCCWGFDEDRRGNLFAGVYHERGEPDCECALYWSADGGMSWMDIGAPEWRSQLHVHHLAVDPGTNWIYAVLGDASELRGCWRSRNLLMTVAEAAPAGTRTIRLEPGAAVFPGDIVAIAGQPARLTVSSVEASKVVLDQALISDVQPGTLALKIDRVAKFKGAEALQFSGICFHRGCIYLADDNGRVRNPGNVLVYRSIDDGTDTAAPLTPVLQRGSEAGWGVFFLEVDRLGRLWTAARPVSGSGELWRSEDGDSWSLISSSSAEDLPCWRGTHTFRDATIGQTGAGRNLSGPEGEMVTPHLNRSMLFR